LAANQFSKRSGLYIKITNYENRSYYRTPPALGLVFLIFGVNFFLHFIPWDHSSRAKRAPSKRPVRCRVFFPVFKGHRNRERVFPAHQPLYCIFLLLLFSLTVNIFLFHALLLPSDLPMAAPMLGMHLFLGIA
jgi:putative oxidoreductase